MKPNQIEHTSSGAIRHTLNGQFKKALDATQLLADELQWGEINDRLSNLRDTYRLMLHYYMQGADDPERKRIFNKLTSRLLQINVLLREELMMRNVTAYEYTEKRYFPHKLNFSKTVDLVDSLSYYHQKKELSAAEETPISSTEIRHLRLNFERLIPDLFMIFWLSTRLGQPEKTAFNQILQPNYPGLLEKCLVVSAITLNLWRMFDDEKLMMLIDACEHENSMVRQRALVGLCFIMSKYNKYLPFFPALRNRVILMADNSRVLENLKNIVLLIAGSSDTDRITKKMQEEILPEMLKISPMIKKKLEEESNIKPDDWSEENPEWSEMLEESGLGEKLQELTNLQLEGADVYMSTFSALKSFPFFNEIAHWLVPFDPEFSYIYDLFASNDKSLISAFLNNSIICNSDKYSFSLSVMQMPTTQREMMSRSFKAEADQLEEITRDEKLLKPNQADKSIARQYIQDLFRFFRLHPRHAEFNDMFSWSLHMHESSLFDILSSSSDIKEQLAEYYFTKSFYKQAVALYEELIQSSEPSAALYQKMGFALQKLSRTGEALQAYLKADMVLPDDGWTVRKIAYCYKLTGNFEKALEHYKHVEFLKPGQLSTQLQIAKCLIAIDKHAEALAIYAKLEKTFPDELKLWRATGWCAFMAGNLHQADYFFEKVVSTLPDAIDMLNAGHIALCLKKRDTALDYYKQSLKMQNASIDLLAQQLEADKPYLLKNGIDTDDLLMIQDALAYSSEGNKE
jgi:tetratricopeptide (TPR) repeat protein